MIHKYLLVYLFGISPFIIAHTVADEGIIEGKIVNRRQFPYQVAVRVPIISHDKNHPEHMICGGGIIRDDFVLTAAHCIVRNDRDHKNILVIAGQKDLRERSPVLALQARVEKIFWPKELEIGVVPSIGDIAVLKLKTRLLLRLLIISNHWLKLPQDNRTYHGVTADIAGFGQHLLDVPGSDFKLRSAKAVVLDDCRNGEFSLTMPKQMLCARVEQHDHSKPRGVCRGDSGSPLVYNGTVIGVLTASRPTCSEVELGGIYARVSSYVTFIHNAVHNITDNRTNTLP